MLKFCQIILLGLSLQALQAIVHSGVNSVTPTMTYYVIGGNMLRGLAFFAA